jgi:NADH-quinone oxidoreductase subunit L
MLNLSLWVLLWPLLGFIILGVLSRIISRGAVLTIAWGACGLAFIFAAINFFTVLGTPVAGRSSDAIIYTWITSGSGTALPFNVSFGLLLDPLSAVMLMIVTGVGLLIHIYSAGYMAEEEDPSFARFFAYLNFFIFAMVLLVAADNFLFLLVGWGLVGLASFLLIGFWYQRRSAVAAAQKAFVINVIGDFGLMLAIFLIFMNFHSVAYQSVFSNTGALASGSSTAIAITLLLFVACAAKSAQLPLYMWLPDAMEGPTPVSALIHAATMVTAGVYLVARAHVLFEAAPVALNVVAGIGGATAIFAAVIALAQLDIKRVLAYSTISQLGYMFMSEGVHNYSGGIFHLTTHAYFKALLFLGAGAVIHSLAGEQDMRKMGGLRQRLPITFWTFLIACLAISGIPPFAGFWSKDDILGSVLAQATATGNAWYYVLWGVGVLTAGLTAFYMFRLFFAVFLGTYRGPATTTQTAHLVDEADGNNHHHGGAVGYYDIYESPAIMTVPLMILALLSIIGGFVGSMALFGAAKWSPLANFLAPLFSGVHTSEVALALDWTSTGLSIVAGLLGILVAWLRYRNGFVYKESKNPFYLFVLNKYYVDEALTFILIKPVLGLSRLATHWLESDALDGGSRGVAWILRGFSAGLRRLQTGYMRNYALAILLGVVLIVVYYAVGR